MLGRLFVWIAGVAGSLLIVAIIWLISHRAAVQPSSETISESVADTYHPTEAWVLQPVWQSQFQRQAIYSGQWVAKRRSTLAFEVGGVLEEVLVDTADQVHAGQTLARLDPASYKLERQQAVAQHAQALALLNEMKAGPRPTTLAAAKAEVAAIESELENLQRELSRQKKLAADGVISESEWDATQSLVTATAKRKDAAQKRLDELESGVRLEQKQAQQAVVDSLKAQIDLLELKIEKTVLKAPFDGVIVETMVDQGAVVAAGLAAIQLMGTDEVEAYIGVPQDVAKSLISAGEQTFELRSAGDCYTAKLNRQLPMVDPATQTILLVFTIAGEANDRIAQPAVGSPVNLHWRQQQSTEGFWVPNDALTQAQRGLWAVFVFDSEASMLDIPEHDSLNSPTLGRVHKQNVEVLYSQDQQSYVRGTLTSGQWIVVGGTHRLLDGQRVQVKKAPPSASKENTEPATERTVDQPMPVSEE